RTEFQSSSRDRSRSGTHQTFEAGRLICAVPSPALRRVEVQPLFRERRRKVIAELRYDSSRSRMFERRMKVDSARCPTPANILRNGSDIAFQSQIGRAADLVQSQPNWTGYVLEFAVPVANRPLRLP